MYEGEVDGVWNNGEGVVVNDRMDINPPAAVQASKLRLSLATRLMCTTCGREDAPFYYLKRSRGLYQVLCMLNDGRGCFAHSARLLCSYQDPDGVQCTLLAEREICFGPDLLRRRQACSYHVGMLLDAASEHRVYPLEE